MSTDRRPEQELVAFGQAEWQAGAVDKSPVIASAVSPQGRSVELTEERWRYIQHHVEMSPQPPQRDFVEPAFGVDRSVLGSPLYLIALQL